MDEVSINSAEIPWERSDEHPETLRKVLRLGPDARPRAVLLKLDPGFEMEAHSHDRVENNYVLEGMFESQGREYPAGSFRRVPRLAVHGPIRSRGGAVVLVLWED